MSFNSALSGLNAATANLSVTSNNIANANTFGFKGSRAEFANVFAVSPFGLSRNAIGAGVKVAGVTQQFGQGAVEFTNNNLDLAVSGQGFFTLNDGGTRVYSRAGNFAPDRQGFVVNPAGARLQVYPPSANGAGFDTGRLTDLQLSTAENPPTATSRITLGNNLPANAQVPATGTFDPDDPTSYNHSTSITVYDSLGVAHVATVYYVKTDNPNEWQALTYVDGDAVGGPQTLEFDGAGALVAPADGNFALPGWTPPNGANPMTLTLDLGQATQFGERYAVSDLRQDGNATGRLTSIEVASDGTVFARFTNGRSTALGQVAMTNFTNPQGLQQLGDNAWAETFESGDPIVGQAGSSSFGLIQSGALEASNVDLTEQLVNMITAQRSFQANAQMITTQDQVTQTILNIR